VYVYGILWSSGSLSEAGAFTERPIFFLLCAMGMGVIGAWQLLGLLCFFWFSWKVISPTRTRHKSFHLSSLLLSPRGWSYRREGTGVRQICTIGLDVI